MPTSSSIERSLSEDLLKHVYKFGMEQREATTESVAGVLQISIIEASNLVARLVDHDLLRVEGQALHLTPDGERYALHVIRAHRLWEHYLAEETGFAEADWHRLAEEQEHTLSRAEVDALAARLGHPTHDPHGDPIPDPTGTFTPHGGQPLTTLNIGQTARIVHFEDEPELVYSQLVAERLYLGQQLCLNESTPQWVKFQAGGTEHVLAPLIARNISVIPQEGVELGTSFDRLSGLKPGETAQVVSLLPTCRGAERRRFFDLGILPGTVIKAEYISPSGDPTAYLIRQSLIALRQEQADMIEITRDLNGTTASIS